MTRRIHVSHLREGRIELSPDQAHHLRDVLRLGVGQRVELFDDHGRVAEAPIAVCTDRGVSVDVSHIREAGDSGIDLTVAAAVPKGDRADWMVEKLSELGVGTFIPLATARSVVLPEGRNKRDRWLRLATESAKQSRRNGVMQITELTPLEHAIAPNAWCLSTASGARPISEMIAIPPPPKLTLFIGPEGGWTDAELQLFADRNAIHLSLTPSILRIETAALTAAAVVMCAFSSNPTLKI